MLSFFRSSSLVIAILGAAALVSCSHADSTRTPAAEPTGEIDGRFVADLQQAFADYKAWGRVDDELRWAPFLCRMPEPGRPTMSAANEGGHSKKLYSLFAKDHVGYVSLGTAEQPLPGQTGTQVVAKESFLPEVVTEPPPKAPSPNGGPPESDHFHPYTTGEDGKTYRASQMVGVYFVIEKSSNTPGTDEGFIYGTVTPTGDVTSAGRVSSCMGCHVQAKHRRFFGPARHMF